MKIERGYYITRSNKLVKILTITNKNVIWPVSGFIDGKRKLRSWTSFGGSSPHYKKDEAENPNYQEETDLIKKVTKKTHPEYFL